MRLKKMPGCVGAAGMAVPKLAGWGAMPGTRHANGHGATANTGGA